ncbi:MAG: polyhydroxyalkanoate synthesis regulator DNA-binding domain-containing protein [Pseudomonadota bacterium]
MITIKQYANGRYYDTDNKKYVKKEDLTKLLAKKSKIKIIDSKTEKDITRKTISQLPEPRKTAKKAASQKTVAVKKWVDDNKKWISKNLDTRINKILSAMNLPTKDQVIKLTSSMDALNHKLAELEKRQAQKIKEMEQKHSRQIKEMEKNQEQQVQQIRKGPETASEEQSTSDDKRLS